MTATAAGLTKVVSKLREALEQEKPPPENPILELLRADPAKIMALAGMQPDPWQASILRNPASRTLLCCTRQAGKSTTAAALALREALLFPPALVLLLSPTLRQSGELFRAKVMPLFRALGKPVAATSTTALALELANGSRIISLPENEEGIRGFSGVTLLVIDEASRASDSLYYATRPMLATSAGKLVALSTPYGKRGFFFSEWGEGGDSWTRIRVTASECPRIPASFLAEEERALGPRWFRQEYFCSFEDSIDSVFQHRHIAAAITSDVKPLFEDLL